jgi:hypothetical protein
VLVQCAGAAAAVVRTPRERERAADMAAVPVVETVHMVPGDGDTSYARNSAFQVSF